MHCNRIPVVQYAVVPLEQKLFPLRDARCDRRRVGTPRAGYGGARPKHAFQAAPLPDQAVWKNSGRSGGNPCRISLLCAVPLGQCCGIDPREPRGKVRKPEPLWAGRRQGRCGPSRRHAEAHGPARLGTCDAVPDHSWKVPDPWGQGRGIRAGLERRDPDERRHDPGRVVPRDPVDDMRCAGPVGVPRAAQQVRDGRPAQPHFDQPPRVAAVRVPVAHLRHLVGQVEGDHRKADRALVGSRRQEPRDAVPVFPDIRADSAAALA